MRYSFWLAVAFTVTTIQGSAQGANEVSLGLGASLLGTGDVTIISVEGEAIHHWNRFLSGTAVLGLGYGDTYWYNRHELSARYGRDATVHLDANFFFSPFGNNHLYRLSIGTGPSLMYVRDQAYYRYGITEQYDVPNHRLSLGASVIVGQSIRVSPRYRLGLKAQFQPYLNGDGAVTLLFKVSKTL